MYRFKSRKQQQRHPEESTIGSVVTETDVIGEYWMHHKGVELPCRVRFCRARLVSTGEVVECIEAMGGWAAPLFYSGWRLWHKHELTDIVYHRLHRVEQIPLVV